MTLTIPSGLWAQQAGYSQTNLVSNIAGVATTTDSQLLNPWGISVLPGQDFWIADNNSGVSTLYDHNGNKDTGLIVTIPRASSNPNGNCRVVELTSYGLTGVTAVLVISFCFAYGGELPRTRKKSSYDLINNAHLNDSPLVETEARSLRFRGNEGKQQETAPASSLQKISRVETGHGAIYGGSFRNDRGTLEALHG
jgi:hypothetical protein